MATPEEIRRRIEQADTTRSARRAAAAQQVGELAQRRAAILDHLENIERELGDVLAAAQDVIDVDELAGFTDLKPADLTAWLASRRTGRGRRRKTTSTPGMQGDARHGPGSRTATKPEQTPAVHEGPVAGRPQDAPARHIAQAS